MILRNRLTIIFYMILFVVMFDMISGRRRDLDVVADLPYGCSRYAGINLTSAHGEVAPEVCIYRRRQVNSAVNYNQSGFFLDEIPSASRRFRFGVLKDSREPVVVWEDDVNKVFENKDFTFTWRLGQYLVWSQFLSDADMPGVGRFVNFTIPTSGKMEIHNGDNLTLEFYQVIMNGVAFVSQNQDYFDKTEIQGGASAKMNEIQGSFNYFMSIRQSPDGDGSWLYHSYLEYNLRTPSFSASHKVVLFDATVPELALPS